jgi:hypothetical protein
MTVKVKVSRSTIQMQGKEQTHEPQVMVTMQVGDKDVINAMEVQVILCQLNLRSLSTINQKIMILNFNKLTGRHSAVSRNGTT